MRKKCKQIGEKLGEVGIYDYICSGKSYVYCDI